MTTATRTPTEADVNDALTAALEAVQDARWMLEAAGATGDDLRHSIRDIDEMRVWYAANDGWTTAPLY